MVLMERSYFQGFHVARKKLGAQKCFEGRQCTHLLLFRGHHKEVQGVQEGLKGAQNDSQGHL